MVYSKRSGGKFSKRVYGRGTKRSYSRTRSAKKASYVSAKRRKPSVSKNASAVKRNTRALKKLSNDKWGAYQSQTQITSSEFTVTASAPAIVHLTNLNSETSGPQVQYPTHTSGHLATALGNLAHFDVFAGPHLGDAADIEKEYNHKQNGPRCKWNFCDLQLEISGFLDNTNVDVWIVQERPDKRPDPWNMTYNTKPAHLPYTVPMFSDISGFGPARFNHKHFKLLHHRKVFLNSKPSSSPGTDAANLADAGEQPTVAATTRHVKHCQIKWKPNQVISQLLNSMAPYETVEQDDLNQNVATPTNGYGNYAYDNISPIKNTFLVITTDDASTLGSSLSGDAVTVSIIRRNVWQDSMD